MKDMFLNALAFNQPIGNWDVSKVTTMERMFHFATAFNKDLSNWKLKANCETTDIFYDCPIEKEYKPKGIKE